MVQGSIKFIGNQKLWKSCWYLESGVYPCRNDPASAPLPRNFRIVSALKDILGNWTSLTIRSLVFGKLSCSQACSINSNQAEEISQKHFEEWWCRSSRSSWKNISGQSFQETISRVNFIASFLTQIQRQSWGKKFIAAHQNSVLELTFVTWRVSVSSVLGITLEIKTWGKAWR